MFPGGRLELWSNCVIGDASARVRLTSPWQQSLSMSWGDLSISFIYHTRAPIHHNVCVPILFKLSLSLPDCPEGIEETSIGRDAKPLV